MKSGKAPGLDGFPVKCLMKGGMAVLEWLVRLSLHQGGMVMSSQITSTIVKIYPLAHILDS